MTAWCEGFDGGVPPRTLWGPHDFTPHQTKTGSLGMGLYTQSQRVIDLSPHKGHVVFLESLVNTMYSANKS